MLFIRDEKTYLQNLNRITAQLKKQKQLIVEPIYNKLQDASMQFMIDDNGNYSFLGLNYFDSDEEGRFQREYFHLPDKMRDLLPKDKHWLRQLTEQLILTMQKHGIHRQYTGAIGIDVMFIADVDKQTKLYPLVEANLRCNMGSVNLSLKKLFADNTRGFWQISTFKNDEAALFYKQQIQKHPIRLMNNKITEGFIPLTPFNSDTRFAAWGVVETES